MFILKNCSTGCCCVDPVVGLQPAHTSGCVTYGSRTTTIGAANALQG